MKTFMELGVVLVITTIFMGCETSDIAPTYTDNSQEEATGVTDIISTTTTTTTNAINITENAIVSVEEGRLIDSPIEGVRYICGNVEDFTNENGVFRCEELPVKFMVGRLLLGEIEVIPEDGIVTPQDLVGVDREDINNSKVSNIAILLQSLDDDEVVEDVITIDDEITNNLNKELDIRELKEDELKELLEDAGVRFVIPKQVALEHLKQNMLRFGIESSRLEILDNNSTDDLTNEDNQDGDVQSGDTEGSSNRFLVDFQNGIVVDKNTETVWQNSKIGYGTKKEAIEFCKHLSLAGVDWTLPTSEESGIFHKYMNKQGTVPEQAFFESEVEITEDGYIITLEGSRSYGGEPGDSIEEFQERADIRCISNGIIKESRNNVIESNDRDENSINDSTNSTDNNIEGNHIETTNTNKNKDVNDIDNDNNNSAVDNGNGNNGDVNSSIYVDNNSGDVDIDNKKSVVGDGEIKDNSENGGVDNNGSTINDNIESSSKSDVIDSNNSIESSNSSRNINVDGDNNDSVSDNNIKSSDNENSADENNGDVVNDDTIINDENEDNSVEYNSSSTIIGEAVDSNGEDSLYSNVNVKPIDQSLKDKFLGIINRARATPRTCGKYGSFKSAPPLVWSDTLYIASYRHSYDMAKVDYISHTGSGEESDLASQAYHPGIGSSITERVNYAGYKGWIGLGENVSAGTNIYTIQEAVNGWINNPEYCQNLMNPNFTEVSVAIIYDEDSSYKYYWTQNFAIKFPSLD